MENIDLSGRIIKTNAYLLNVLANEIRKNGCQKCGKKLLIAGLCYIKQINELPDLRYEILCEDCWRK